MTDSSANPACPLCLSPLTDSFCERTDSGFGSRLYFKCPVCSLVFLSPESRLPREAEKKRYDSHKNDPKDERYRNFLRRLAEPLSAKLKTGGASGLDFGCGPGPAMSSLFRDKGHEMQDYDPLYRPVPSLLERRYDFVTCSEVVEHLHDPHQEFLQLDKLLKPGAFLGIMTGILTDETIFQSWWYPKDPTHVCFYQEKTLEWIAGWLRWKLDRPAVDVAIFQKLAEVSSKE